MTNTELLTRRYGWRITRTALITDMIAGVCLALPAVLIVSGVMPTDSVFFTPILIGVPGFGLMVGAIGEAHENHEKIMNRLQEDDIHD